MKKCLALILVLFFTAARAQTDSTSVGDDLLICRSKNCLKLDLVDRNFYLYGYINSNFQKTFSYPTIGDDGSTQTEL
jgi:hypothetical protein